MARFRWTPQRIQYLRDRLAADATGYEIRAELGCSVHALRVKMWKLGLHVSPAARRRAGVETQTGKWDNPEFRAKATAAIAKAWHGAEERRKAASERTRRQWAEGRCVVGPCSSLTRAKISAARRGLPPPQPLIIRSAILEAQTGHRPRQSGVMQPPPGYDRFKHKLPEPRYIYGQSA